MNAHNIRTGGIRAGDRVAVGLSPNTGAAAVLSAIAGAGAAVVPLDPTLGDKAAVVRAHEAGAGFLLTADGVAKIGGAAEPAADLHSVVFTSGSTGAPRPVRLTWANQRASARGAAARLALTADDRWIACLPVHHVGGLNVFVRAQLLGFTVVPVWPFDPRTVIDAAAGNEATAISLVPTMLHRMLDAGWEPAPSMRFVLLGGAACPRSLLERALERGLPLCPSYGMTETCSQIATPAPHDVRDHPGTSGRAIDGAEIRITDDGRVAVRGPMVSPDAAGSNGWFETNDLGSLDEEGFLTIDGRADEVIVTGGEKVTPQEIESLLTTDPGVSEAAVVGLPDVEWGERVVAAVVAAPGASPYPQRLREALGSHVDAYKVPKDIVILPRLPMLGPGKPDRRALRDELGKVIR